MDARTIEMAITNFTKQDKFASKVGKAVVFSADNNLTGKRERQKHFRPPTNTKLNINKAEHNNAPYQSEAHEMNMNTVGKNKNNYR